MSIFGALPTEMARGGDAADAAAAAAPPRVASVVRSKTNFPRPRARPPPNPTQPKAVSGKTLVSASSQLSVNLYIILYLSGIQRQNSIFETPLFVLFKSLNSFPFILLRVVPV